MVFQIDLPLPLLPHCAYTITDQSGVVQFVGFCQTTQLLRHASETLNQLSGTITLSIIHTDRHPYAARNAVYGWVRDHGLPPLNLRTPCFNRPVLCVNTGVTYRNARQAALHHDISVGLMSKHLAGDPKYRTIKGLIFEYI
jgi:hypothetical protein